MVFPTETFLTFRVVKQKRRVFDEEFEHRCITPKRRIRGKRRKSPSDRGKLDDFYFRIY